MPHDFDEGKDRFRKLVSDAPEAEPRLPLIHSTDIYLFEEALEDAEIRPQACDVFEGEALTYFFYGRPSFRPNASADPSGLGHYFPVCMIFKPEFTSTIRRIFPFDSGAFHNGLYRNYLHRRMKMGDFGLEPSLSTPGKLISLFFGSIPAYLSGQPEVTQKLDPSQFEAHSYSALIGAKDSNSIDSRGSGIEIQIAENISLDTAVAAVVMPSTFADGSTGAKLKKFGIDIIPYRVFERTKPGEYTSQLHELCMNYYIRQKILSEGDL